VPGHGMPSSIFSLPYRACLSSPTSTGIDVCVRRPCLILQIR
jgi:hypothetical protein